MKKILLICIAIILTGALSIMIYKAFFDSKNPEDPKKNENTAVQDFALSQNFVKKDIYTDALYKQGILPYADGGYAVKSIDPTATDERSIVLAMDYGKTYEIHFPDALDKLLIVTTSSNPCTM